MNIKLRAAIETVCYFVVIILIASILQLIVQHFTDDELKSALSTFGIFFCMYIIYSLRLSSLEAKKSIEKLTSKV
jgi:hypothetical protein